MAAVDPDPIDKKSNAINTKIMELTTSLARIEGSELHVAHAWSLYGESLMTGFIRMSQSEVDKLVRQTRKEHQGRITELVGKHVPRLLNGRIHLLKGNAEELKPALAK